MKNGIRLIKAYGKNEVGMADLPFKVSRITIARILVGGELDRYEVTHHHYIERQRNWKKQRKTQWKLLRRG